MGAALWVRSTAWGDAAALGCGPGMREHWKLLWSLHRTRSRRHLRRTHQRQRGFTVVVAVLTYLYFLRYPDRWFVFSKRVREMANDEWW